MFYMWSMLTIIKPALMSMLHPHVHLVMNLFLRVGNKNNFCIRETQENLIENSSTN